MQTVNLNGFFINSFDVNKINNFICTENIERGVKAQNKEGYSIFNLNFINFFEAQPTIDYLLVLESMKNKLVSFNTIIRAFCQYKN